jgi:hypothetical protein
MASVAPKGPRNCKADSAVYVNLIMPVVLDIQSTIGTTSFRLVGAAACCA